MSLPELASKWGINQFSITNVNPGVKRVIEPNAKRLCIGFSHLGPGTISVFPIVNDNSRFEVPLINTAAEWFYWEKHAAIVGLAWGFSNNNLAGDTVTCIELFQSAQGK